MHGDEMVMPSLKGARVLVVQNDPFVAADLDLIIDEAEGKVVAIATSWEDALSLLDHEPVDIAIVDPNLRDGEAASVIATLNRRGVPFVTYASVKTGKYLTSAILSVGVERSCLP
jgi:DNA-binding NarL/FixJ family response regulator